MKAAMPHRVYLGWQRYWDMEPWGPWRDNMHTAVLAREIRRTTRGASIPDLSVWLLRSPLDRAYEASGKIMSMLGTVGTKMSAKEASAEIRKHRRSKAKSKVKR